MSLRIEEATGLLSAKQLASIEWSKRRKLALWVGAVSAGKTFASLIAFLFALLDAPAGKPIVMIGKTLQTIERNVITVLQDPGLFGELAAHTIHTPGSSFAIILGRRVELIGANNASAEEKIRGGTFGLAYVDEATLLPPNFWAMLLTRLRTKGARLLATTNPGSRNHWLKTNYIDRADAVNMIVFHLTMRDNPSLDADYIRDMENTYTDRVLHARFILGLWTAAEGAVYADFDDRVKPIEDHAAHVIDWRETPELADVISIGMDYGTANASTGLLLGLTAERTAAGLPRPRLILLDEWRYDSRKTGIRLTPDAQAAKFAEWYHGGGRGFQLAHTPRPILFDRPKLIAIDPAAPHFRTAMLNAGFNNQAAANDVRKGIATIGNLIASHHLLVTNRCEGFLAEVTEYVWDQKKADEEGIDYPVTENDHSLDGARYAIYTSRPLWWPVLKSAYRLAA